MWRRASSSVNMLAATRVLWLRRLEIKQRFGWGAIVAVSCAIDAAESDGERHR